MPGSDWTSAKAGSVRSGQRPWRTAAVLAATWVLLVGAVSAMAAEARPATLAAQGVASGRAVHIRLTGDFDCMKLEQEFRAAVEKARQDRASTLLIELSGNRWRGDVTLALMKAVREAQRSTNANEEKGAVAQGGPVRVVAFLNDPGDRRVGGGQAAVALCCDVVVQAPATKIAASFADEIVDPTASDEESAGRAAELRQELEAACTDEGRSASWSLVFPRAARAVWWEGVDPWTETIPIIRETKPGPKTDFGAGIIAGPEGADEKSLSVLLSADDAIDAGLARATANSANMALASAEIKHTGMKRVEIVSNLSRERERLHGDVKEIDRLLRQTDADLREAGRYRSNETLGKRRAAGRNAQRELGSIQKRIDEAESVVKEYPELLGDVPPGQTTVGQTPDRLVSVWRSLFQRWRDDLADITVRAETMANANSL